MKDHFKEVDKTKKTKEQIRQEIGSYELNEYDDEEVEVEVIKEVKLVDRRKRLMIAKREKEALF